MEKAAFSQYQRNINSNHPDDVPLLNGYANHPGMGYSIRTDRYRYTEWWRTVSSNDTLDLHVPMDDSPAHIELYDYLSDPEETINLATDPAYSGLVEELSALLNDGDATHAGDGWKQGSVDAPAEYPDNHTSWADGYKTPGLPDNALDLPEDPDADGWANAFEYKFGTHPLEFDDPGVNHSFDPEGLHITYPEVVSRTDVALNAERSSSLSGGSWTSAGVSVQDTGAIGNTTLRKGSAPLESGRAFIRLSSN
jgi:hypothetical protein